MRLVHRLQRRQRAGCSQFSLNGGGIEPGHQGLGGPFHHGQPDRLLAGKVPEHRALGDAHRLREVTGGDVGGAALGRQLQGCFHQTALTDFGGLPGTLAGCFHDFTSN